MPAMTPLQRNARMTVEGDDIEGYTAYLYEGGEQRFLAYTNGEDPTELRDFEWLVRSAATFHHLPFTTVTEEKSKRGELEELMKQAREAGVDSE